MERKLRMIKKIILNLYLKIFVLGFLETEIKKDELPIYDPEDNPDAPKPREMIDLEVIYFLILFLFH
jgi:hypothetical protein